MRRGKQAVSVLRLFLAVRGEETAGADIARIVGMSNGTLYPMLARFERAGWLKMRSEDGEPQKLKRPLRKLYRMTGAGRKAAEAWINGSAT